jgi:hypothetical protein
MTSDEPGSGQPDSAEPPAPPAPPADASPTEVVPPAPAPAPEPVAPAPEAPAAWGAPPAAAAAEPPPAEPGAPAPTAWGGPPAAAAPQPPAPEPAAPAQPPAGQPPSGQPPTQPGTWGAPAPQQPAGWAPAAAPGGAPPSGTWSPAPATSSGNGCLKACLVVAIILVVLAILAVAGILILGRQVVSDLGVNPDTGEVTECSLVSNDKLNAVFGGSDAQAMPMGGIADATIGQVLDKRILRDAPDCWIVASGTAQSVTGRIAAQDGLNASGDFQSAKAAAQAGGYFGGDAPGIGEEAFCTGASEAGSFGILVHSGGRLVYVSLLDPRSGAIGDWVITQDGVTTSPDTCQLAGEIAAAVLQ